MAAETNDHKCGGLKHHRFTPQLRNRTQVSLGRNQGVSRPAFHVEALGENPCPGFCQLLEAAHILWLAAPSSFFKASSVSNFASLSLILTLRPPSSRDLVIDYIGVTQIIQDNLPISKPFT